MAQLMALPTKRRKFDDVSEPTDSYAKDAARPVVPLIGAMAQNALTSASAANSPTPQPGGPLGAAMQTQQQMGTPLGQHAGLHNLAGAAPAISQGMNAVSAFVPGAGLGGDPTAHPKSIANARSEMEALPAVQQQRQIAQMQAAVPSRADFINQDTNEMLGRANTLQQFQASPYQDFGQFQRAQAVQQAGAAGLVPRQGGLVSDPINPRAQAGTFAPMPAAQSQEILAASGRGVDPPPLTEENRALRAVGGPSGLPQLPDNIRQANMINADLPVRRAQARQQRVQAMRTARGLARSGDVEGARGAAFQALNTQIPNRVSPAEAPGYFEREQERAVSAGGGKSTALDVAREVTSRTRESEAARDRRQERSIEARESLAEKQARWGSERSEIDNAAKDAGAERAAAVNVIASELDAIEAEAKALMEIQKSVLADEGEKKAALDSLSKLEDKRASVLARVRAEFKKKPAGGAAPAAGGTQDNPAKPADQASFDKLPSGAWFINPADGKLLQKK